MKVLTRTPRIVTQLLLIIMVSQGIFIASSLVLPPAKGAGYEDFELLSRMNASLEPGVVAFHTLILLLLSLLCYAFIRKLSYSCLLLWASCTAAYIAGFISWGFGASMLSQTEVWVWVPFAGDSILHSLTKLLTVLVLGIGVPAMAAWLLATFFETPVKGM